MLMTFIYCVFMKIKVLSVIPSTDIRNTTMAGTTQDSRANTHVTIVLLPLPGMMKANVIWSK